MTPAMEQLRRESYTYADYAGWDEDFRGEIIDGALYVCSSPLTVHQRIAGRLFVKIANFLEGKEAEVFIAPFGVRLFPRTDNRDGTVLEPDIVVVSDPAKIDGRGCNGAPDLVIEVESPSSFRKDRVLKFNAYLKAKVREYWLVDPERRELTVYLYDNGHYRGKVYGPPPPLGGTPPGGTPLGGTPPDRETGTVPVTVLPGLEIDRNAIFS